MWLQTKKFLIYLCNPDQVNAIVTLGLFQGLLYKPLLNLFIYSLTLHHSLYDMS